MPYHELPARGLTTFYTINPDEPIIYTSVQAASSEPRSRPFDPSKPVVVLLHAGSFSTSSFTAQFADPRLKAAYNLVGIDLRFHGRTKGAEQDSMKGEELGEDVVALLDDLEFKSYAIFGESHWGSLVAAWVTVKRPEKVVCLMMASPGSPQGETPEEFAATVARIDLCMMNKGGRGDKSGNLPQEAIDAITVYFLGSEDRYMARKHEYRTAMQLRYGAGSPEYEFRMMYNLVSSGRDVSDEQLATVRCPVLLLQGGDDFTLSPIEATRGWQSLFTGAPGGADLREIIGGPHILTISESSILNRMLLSFVNRSLNGTTQEPATPLRSTFPSGITA